MTVLDHPTAKAADLWHMSELDVADLARRLAGRPVPGVRWTERKFVEWSFGRFDAEWLDGKVVLMSPVNDAHDSLEVWLTALIQLFIEARSLGALRSNMFVRLPRRRRLRVPDLMFIAEANRRRIRPAYIAGPPDLIVEIVSPDSQNRDRREKYAEYEAAGVREYWLIDPLSETLDVYALRGRKYQAVRPREGKLDSAVLAGLYLRPEWLFAARRPKVAHVLKELGVTA